MSTDHRFGAHRLTMMSVRELDLLDCLEHNDRTGDLDVVENELVE